MMKAFLVSALIVCHLFANSTASSVHGRAKNKGNNGLCPVVNGTAPDHQYHQTGSRRVQVPTDQCYRQYFVANQPPTGFRLPNSLNIKRLCQQVPEESDRTLFATMFDLILRIPVYAGYRLTRPQVAKMDTFPRISKWVPGPDIDQLHQANDATYDNNGIFDRGHLVPAATYSFDCVSMVSTFRYTNAVPQYAAFNRGQWSQYEKKVREFAKLCRGSDGELYLLTGISEAKTQQTGIVKKNLKYFPHDNPAIWTNIAIPNSMWTTGCCIHEDNDNALGAFAFIGNNEDNPTVYQGTVRQLQQTLAIGVGGGAAINLFPGKDECSDDANQLRHGEQGWKTFN